MIVRTRSMVLAEVLDNGNTVWRTDASLAIHWLDREAAKRFTDRRFGTSVTYLGVPTVTLESTPFISTG